jgi:hypothetical protein
MLQHLGQPLWWSVIGLHIEFRFEDLFGLKSFVPNPRIRVAKCSVWVSTHSPERRFQVRGGQPIVACAPLEKLTATFLENQVEVSRRAYIPLLSNHGDSAISTRVMGGDVESSVFGRVVGNQNLEIGKRLLQDRVQA